MGWVWLGILHKRCLRQLSTVPFKDNSCSCSRAKVKRVRSWRFSNHNLPTCVLVTCSVAKSATVCRLQELCPEIGVVEDIPNRDSGNIFDPLTPLSTKQQFWIERSLSHFIVTCLMVQCHLSSRNALTGSLWYHPGDGRKKRLLKQESCRMHL